MFRYFFSIFIVVLLVAGCSTTPASVNSGANESPAMEVQGEEILLEDGTYTNITVAELQTMLQQKDFQLINVHIPDEGDLPDTDLSIPYNEIDQHLDQLPEDQNAKLVLYCRSDRMSTIAAEQLVDLGYTNVWNLKGGMVAWEQAGRPLK